MPLVNIIQTMAQVGGPYISSVQHLPASAAQFIAHLFRHLESQQSRPFGSAKFIGLFLTYAYWLIPPANPIGSLCRNLPALGS